MTTIWQDLRFGVRMLSKKPGFTAVVVLTLAIGIGAKTAIFSFLDRALLRPLLVKNARELVKVECQYEYQHGNQSGMGKDNELTCPLYRSYLNQSQVFSGLIAYMPFGKTSDLSDVCAGDSVGRVASLAVSSDYFSVLGINPVIGRSFLSEKETGHGAQSVAVISHSLWRRLFDCDLADEFA